MLQLFIFIGKKIEELYLLTTLRKIHTLHQETLIIGQNVQVIVSEHMISHMLEDEDFFNIELIVHFIFIFILFGCKLLII